MKLTAAICLVLLTLSFSVLSARATAETSAFEEARRIGEGTKESFFLFSTAAGKYTIRSDGMGEVEANAKRRAFYLKLGMAGRVDRVYFHEYEGDLLLLYGVNNGRGGYVVRMNQQTRKPRWITPLDEEDIGPCSIADAAASCGTTTKIDLRTGEVTTERQLGINSLPGPTLSPSN